MGMRNFPSLVATSLLLLLLREGGLEAAADITAEPWKTCMIQRKHSSHNGLLHYRMRGGEGAENMADASIKPEDEPSHDVKGDNSCSNEQKAHSKGKDAPKAAENSGNGHRRANKFSNDGMYGRLEVMKPGTCKKGDTVVVTGDGVVFGAARAYMGLKGVVEDRGTTEGCWKIKFEEDQALREVNETQLGHFKLDDPRDYASLAAGAA